MLIDQEYIAKVFVNFSMLKLSMTFILLSMINETSESIKAIKYFQQFLHLGIRLT